MAKRKKRKVWPIVLVNGELTRAARRALRPARLEREIAMCHMKVVAYKADFEAAHDAIMLLQGVDIPEPLRLEWRVASNRYAGTHQLLKTLQAEQQRRARAAALDKDVNKILGEINGQSPHRP